MRPTFYCLYCVLLIAITGCSCTPPQAPHMDLSVAIDKQDLVAVRAALERGADPNDLHFGPKSFPLYLAAEKENLELAKLLLEKGANANYPGATIPGDLNTFKYGIPLNSAAYALDLDMVQLLIEHGADVNADIEYAGGLNTPTQAAIAATAQRGLNPPITPEQQQTAIAIVKLLVEKGAKPTRPSHHSDGRVPPLHWAAQMGDLPLVQWLAEHGFDVKTTTWNGYTSLDYAAMGGNVELMQWLLAQNVELDTPNENGWSPLYFAITGGHSSAVKFLLEEAGCNVNGSGDPKTNYAGTPLHWAVTQSKLAIVKQLIDAGADLTLRNKVEQTPLGLAMKQLSDPIYNRQSGRQAIADYLREHGAPE